MEIAVGLITAPRHGLNPAEVIEELRFGGFTDKLNVFCEPGTVEMVSTPLLAIHCNEARRGLVGNWAYCLRWLVENTEAPYLLVAEDDAKYCRAARQVLEKELNCNGNDFGFLSLYTPKRDEQLMRNGTGWIKANRGRDAWGTLSMCFNRRSAAELLSFQRLYDEDQMRGPTDSIVCECFLTKGIPCYYHNPSLTDHIGKLSTVSHNWYPEHTGLRFDKDFAG